MSDDDSALLRARGNEAYHKAAQASPTESIRCLDTAAKWYKRALMAARDTDEESSAAKNLATAANRRAQTMNELDEAPDAVLEQYHTAISHFQKALFKGSATKTEKWEEAVRQTCVKCVKDSVEVLGKLPEAKVRVTKVGVLLGAVEDFPGRQYYLLQLARDHQSQAKSALDVNDHRDALDHLRDIHQPLENLLHLPASELYPEAQQLKREVRDTTQRAEAQQTLHNGIKLYESLEDKEDDAKVDMMYDAIDNFRQTIIKTREKEFELEAKAHYYLGKVYDTILNNVTRAQEYYAQAQFLFDASGQTSKPEWYADASSALARYKAKTEDTSVEEDIKDIQDNRKKCNDRFGDFIKYTLDKFPPKKPPNNISKLPEFACMDKKGQERFLTKVVLAYHPDKQVKYKDKDTKWMSICDEISKQLNKMLETYRGR